MHVEDSIKRDQREEGGEARVGRCAHANLRAEFTQYDQSTDWYYCPDCPMRVPIPRQSGQATRQSP